ncbi:dihydrodipicolinate synthase family protein [Gordonia soli]|uniref:Putative dihydrodipicolinate synthase n=1 Tax=Gordonia soli NBRC 108243 TaxID=1223545 RepID=M0QGV4_9ACTN|nr:dihydrodipicolinate synthase family protein [Gordonia soli]GAC67674.1 putative dihydrodipicolinate synthase [Gordonia soli NBRC 108243]
MTLDEVRRRLAGVVSIPVTPFAATGTIDEPALIAINRRMADAGIPVITPNGNTGEYYSLTREERSRCVDLAMISSGQAAVLVGVGGALADAIDEARYARSAGAHAVMVHQPVHPYITRAGWIDYHAAIATAVPELGLVTYVKNLAIDGSTIGRLADAVDNFIGVKYALPDPVGFASAIADAGDADLVWIAGLAESYAASGFAATATGFTSGLANVVPDVSLAYLQALRDSDWAGALSIWKSIRAFEDLRARDNNALNVSVVKEALHQLGLCDRAVRAPISTLDDEDRRAVTAMLAEWGLVESGQSRDLIEAQPA